MGAALGWLGQVVETLPQFVPQLTRPNSYEGVG